MSTSISPKKFKFSLFAGATLLFFLLNGAASIWFAKYKENVHEDFAAQALQASPTKPDVVFAGSSTVLYPMYALDSSSYGPQPGFEQYTRVHFVEDALSRETKRKVQVNNISFLGFMISDDLFVIKNYLEGKHAPETLVLMVAPRDFCDSLFESPAAGVAFRKLSSWSNTIEFCGTYLTQPNDYIDFLLGKGVFTYAMRAKIQDKLYDYVADKQAAGQPVQPITASATPDQKWAKSIREYSTRYKNISFEKMQKQFVFLNRLLNTCKERDIRVILVNAPLTKRSLEMLPAGLYDSYCNQLANAAKTNHCRYSDFSHSAAFSNDDFSDIVHLNQVGAKKVVEAILPNVRESMSNEPLKTATTTDNKRPL
ncbi:hypothetical protein BH10CYA1_BH10CYA1_55080 [soil metagenome]